MRAWKRDARILSLNGIIKHDYIPRFGNRQHLGALTFGMAEKLNPKDAKNKTLTTGGFALMPARMNHYAFTTTEETTIVLYGQGPVEFRYGFDQCAAICAAICAARRPAA